MPHPPPTSAKTRSDIFSDDLLPEQPESTDPHYLEWKKSKIKAAIQHADENPDAYLTEQEIWQKHGLDY